MSKKDVPQWHIYPPFHAHSSTRVCCIGLQQNQFLFKIGHSPLFKDIFSKSKDGSSRTAALYIVKTARWSAPSGVIENTYQGRQSQQKAKVEKQMADGQCMRLTSKDKYKSKLDCFPSVPKDAERHWDVNLILFNCFPCSNL